MLAGGCGEQLDFVDYLKGLASGLYREPEEATPRDELVGKRKQLRWEMEVAGKKTNPVPAPTLITGSSCVGRPPEPPPVPACPACGSAACVGKIGRAQFWCAQCSRAIGAAEVMPRMNRNDLRNGTISGGRGRW